MTNHLERALEKLDDLTDTAKGLEKIEDGTSLPSGPIELEDVFHYVDDMSPGSPAHKVQRWERYQKRKPDSKMTYEEWSRRYDANMKNAKKGNNAADQYQKEIGWGDREVPIRNEDGKIVRKLDIADVDAKKAVEVKDYSSKNVPYDKQIKAELDFDKKLVEEGWDIEWVFKDKGPSKGLEEALKNPPPIKTILK